MGRVKIVSLWAWVASLLIAKYYNTINRKQSSNKIRVGSVAFEIQELYHMIGDQISDKKIERTYLSSKYLYQLSPASIISLFMLDLQGIIQWHCMRYMTFKINFFWLNSPNYHEILDRYQRPKCIIIMLISYQTFLQYIFHAWLRTDYRLIWKLTALIALTGK
jgi:hypothetical protein